METDKPILEKIEQIVQEHQHTIRTYHCGDLDDKIKSILRHYQDVAAGALAGSKAIRDDLLSYFRAMALICDMATGAQSHGEKNARLRGMVELLESAIERLRKQDFDVAFTIHHFPDIFHSDYPTRYYVDRIHQLERQLKEFTGGSSTESQA